MTAPVPSGAPEDRRLAPPGTVGGQVTGGSVLGRTFPPVTQLCVGSMALVIVGGIWMAAHLPRRPPLGPAVGLLAAGVALLVLAVALLTHISPFAWRQFLLVAKWALAAYLVIAGLLELVFVKDGTAGTTLGLLTAMLAVFALDVPMIMGFTVARYQEQAD